MKELAYYRDLIRKILNEDWNSDDLPEPDQSIEMKCHQHSRRNPILWKNLNKLHKRMWQNIQRLSFIDYQTKLLNDRQEISSTTFSVHNDDTLWISVDVQSIWSDTLDQNIIKSYLEDFLSRINLHAKDLDFLSNSQTWMSFTFKSPDIELIKDFTELWYKNRNKHLKEDWTGDNEELPDYPNFKPLLVRRKYPILFDKLEALRKRLVNVHIEYSDNIAMPITNNKIRDLRFMQTYLASARPDSNPIMVRIILAKTSVLDSKLEAELKEIIQDYFLNLNLDIVSINEWANGREPQEQLLFLATPVDSDILRQFDRYFQEVS